MAPDPTEISVQEAHFRAMGSNCHIIIRGGDSGALERAEHHVRHLESLWSRFRPDSEISLLNAAAGAPHAVSRETVTLLCRALRAQRITGGWFNPFMGRDLIALGYDRDFEKLIGVDASRSGTKGYTLTRSGSEVLAQELADYSAFAIDVRSRTVRLPGGVDFDPGGIGKGLGADLVTLQVINDGALGALVNLGGDLRCRGEHPDDGWEIRIENPLDIDGTLDEYVRITEGAVATSTPLKRNWAAADGSRSHHLLNPRTRDSTPVEIASATVIAPTGWEAEMLVKTLLIAGPDIGIPLLRKHRAAGVVVTLDGSVVQV